MMAGFLDVYREFLFWLRDYQLAAIAFFVGTHVLFAILVLPCSQFTTLAGVLWGPWVGLGVSMLGAVSSASATFGIGRHLSTTRLVERLVTLIGSKRVGPLLEMMNQMNWRGVFLVQVNPIVPASTMGYFFGMTRIRFRTFCATSTIAILPLQVIYVMFGALIHDGAQFSTARQIVPTILGLIIAVCTFFVIKRRFVSARDSLFREAEQLGAFGDTQAVKK